MFVNIVKHQALLQAIRNNGRSWAGLVGSVCVLSSGVMVGGWSKRQAYTRHQSASISASCSD